MYGGDPHVKATSENLGIKACDRDKSGVYTKVRNILSKEVTQSPGFSELA